ncbi:hypothetical protein IM538_13825 [Cytobacillus suaedae]|nr:hypothetical protein IM538_13825 [Cytobacillus suaedae]
MKKIWIIGSLIFLIVGGLILNSYISNKRNIETASQVVHNIGDLFSDKIDLTIDDVSLVQTMLNDADKLVYFGMYKYPVEQKVENIKFIELDNLEKVVGIGVRHGGNNNNLYGYEVGNWFFEWKVQEVGLLH